jgi:hypothetical protein
MSWVPHQTIKRAYLRPLRKMQLSSSDMAMRDSSERDVDLAATGRRRYKWRWDAAMTMQGHAR